MALLLVEIFQLVARDYPIAVQVHYFEPVFNTLKGRLVLHTHDEPNEVAKTHLLFVFKFFDRLGEDALEGFPRKSVA